LPRFRRFLALGLLAVLSTSGTLAVGAGEWRLDRETSAQWRALDDEAKRLLQEGRMDLAERYMRRALDAAMRLPGEDPRKAAALNNLGYVLAKRGAFEAAAEAYENSLAMREAVLGPADPATAQVAADLGQVRLTQGDHDAAAHLLARAFTARERLYGPEHPLTKRTHAGLVRALLLSGQTDKATEAITSMTEEHPAELAAVLFALAEAEHRAGRPEASEAAMERAQALLEGLPNREPVSVLPHLNARARLAYEMGDIARAEVLTAQAESLLEGLAGTAPDSEEAVTTLLNRATVLLALGRIEEAQAYVQRTAQLESQPERSLER
jgi:tetratricopeptide (TPR) repeat protein